MKQKKKIPYGAISENTRTPLKDSTVDVLNSRMREPCSYCGKRHLEYACDDQVEHIKNKLKRYGK